MLNLNELEKKWLHYKIKSYFPKIIISVTLMLVVFVLSSTYFTKKDENSNVTAKTEVAVEPAEKEKTQQKQPQIENKTYSARNNQTEQKEIITTAKMEMSPSFGFMRTMHGNSPQYYNSQEAKKPTKIYKKKTIAKPIIEVEEVKTEIVKDNTVNIKRQNTQDDIQHVIKRFKKTNNPALSLFVSKKYYEIKNYNQAYNYALMTNEINNDIEESWIIFAKSLVKLNKKSKAIEMLTKYINQSHSNRARILLDNIKSGKMK